MLGKFLASWIFTGIALALTFPIWITVNYLGDPDNGVILASYVGSFVMAGAYLAIGSCLSALTKNQVIAFIMSATVCFLFTMSGAELVQDFVRTLAPEIVSQAIFQMSFLAHFESVTRGLIDLRDAVFFASLIAIWLFANVVIIDIKKGS